ncbi:methyltransferase family protein [Ruegeria sp. P4]|nr:methyltransferase family protein [Ruegeria sp. P4]
MRQEQEQLNVTANKLVSELVSGAVKLHQARVQTQIDNIPNYKLGKENIAGCQLVVDREELLKRLPSGGVVAELGVDQGGFSAAILEHNAPSQLHLVDIWGDARYHEGKAKGVFAKFSEELETGKVAITRALSLDAVDAFADETFDWIYIDTDHSYATTIAELRAWAPKVKANGFIAGHDYTMGNFATGYKYGVIEAVAEFCVQNGWKLSYLTADYNESNSFAISRIMN